MSAHAPKIGALQAYAEDLLSERGRARLERHLAECEVCRKALATIEVYRRTLDDVRDLSRSTGASGPELDWSRMELALAREARAQAERATVRSNRAPREGIAALVLAVAAVVALAVWPNDPLAPVAIQPVAPPEAAPTIPPAPEPARAMAAVTLIGGRATARAAGEADPRALEVGAEIFAGETIATEDGSALHAAIDPGAGIALAAATELALATADDGTPELTLARGAVTSQIDPARIAAGSRFVVLAAEHRFVAQGTRFEVALDATERTLVQLRVAEGEVAVHRPDGTVVVVRAPGTWSSATGIGAAEPELASPIHGEARSYPLVRVERAGIVRWEIGQVALEGRDVLAMRAPPGELAIAGFDESGRAFRTVAVVGADGLALGADALVPEPPRVREGFLPPDDIREVVHGGTPRLTQCYSAAARAQRELEGLEGVATVRVTIAFDGSVARTRVQGEGVPDALAECVRTHAGRWIFPPPQGGPVTFEFPLRFSAR